MPDVHESMFILIQILMSVCLIPVTPMQHVVTVLLASPVLVSVATQEMAFSVKVGLSFDVLHNFLHNINFNDDSRH